MTSGFKLSENTVNSIILMEKYDDDLQREEHIEIEVAQLAQHKNKKMCNCEA